MAETRAMLVALDLACLYGGMALAAHASGKFSGTSGPILVLGAQMLGLGLLWLILAIVADIYDLGNASSWMRTHRATLSAVVTVLMFRSAYEGSVHVFAGSIPYMALSVGAIFTLRTIYALCYTVFPLKHRAVIFGAGLSGQELARAMCQGGNHIARGYEVVGFLDDDPDKQGESFFGVPVLGNSHDLMHVVDRDRVDLLVVAINSSPTIRASSFPSLLNAREAGMNIVSMPTMYEYITRKVAVDHAGSGFGVYFPLEDYKQPFVYDVLKRFIDIGAGLLGCVIFLLSIPFVMLVNKFGNPGPLIYAQTRVGQGGRLFRIFKFRSMVPDAEKAGAQWCKTDDPRITKIGNILRKTRIDEIPQFWNVLKGDMSMIGPRPERPEFIHQLEKGIPFYRARHAVKPGLTGWAQVMYRYGASEEDTLVKLQYDLYYIKHRSILLDLRIVAKTVLVVLGAKGR